MHKPRSVLLAASSIVLAVAVTGCAMGGSRSHFGGVAKDNNIGVAMRAHVALAQGDVESAVSFAEKAVEKSPSDAAFRALLGNAYLAAGRFRSAEAAYADALAIYPDLAGIPLKLALTQAAQGRGEAAAATLETFAGAIGAADAGLAMALAGRPGAAIETLELAARQPDADARVRQNLALAHAIAGDWTRARQVAAQDLAGDQLEQRISEWAAFARPGAATATQVAALIGVKAPAGVDSGMPVRLALKSDTGAAEVRSASLAQPAPVLVYSEAVPPQQQQQQQELASAEPVQPAAPVRYADSSPDVAEMVDSLRAERVVPGGSLPRVAELRRTAAKRFGSSQTVVQLGAYATEAGVKEGWSKIARRHSGLSAYIPASARFADSRGTVYRLSLKGFVSDGEARQLCMKLKASGATCFVRNAAGDAPVRFASR